MYASRSLPGLRTRSAPSALAVASVAAGVLAFFFLSLLLAPLAVLTGHLALRHSGGRSDPGGTVLARTGVVLGIGVLVVYAVLLVARS
ncbi:DUF4190 domain-containing protein [Streptomyces yaizuensis]|uniref:DUF4190 domain-containing protein n=1 Tax=Streptomyces yaizuensis TaxID=2989713 RepID=A0ABQ5NRM9_9ACTN|nr:DUF4190 domain-containing protein [Streptomyces sp. YSPA8]GLF93028.1 DUF4190 domain-containing protein [Streptomyces sp. YSPA8]